MKFWIGVAVVTNHNDIHVETSCGWYRSEDEARGITVNNAMKAQPGAALRSIAIYDVTAYVDARPA